MTYQIPRDVLQRINSRPFWLDPSQKSLDRCHACHTENPQWTIDDDIWAAVMEDDGGILCPTCFILIAQSRGIVDESNLAWKLTPVNRRGTPRRFTGYVE